MSDGGQEVLNVKFPEPRELNNKQVAVTADFSAPREPNIKPVRLSQLQKWVLQNTWELPREASSLFALCKEAQELPSYQVLSRKDVVGAFFKPATPSAYKSAQVVLSRSLATMEQHGLILRLTFFRDTARNLTLWRYALRPDATCDDAAKAVAALPNPSRKLEFLTALNGEGKTKVILLTAQGLVAKAKVESTILAKEAHKR